MNFISIFLTPMWLIFINFFSILLKNMWVILTLLLVINFILFIIFYCYCPEQIIKLAKKVSDTSSDSDTNSDTDICRILIRVMAEAVYFFALIVFTLLTTFLIFNPDYVTVPSDSNLMTIKNPIMFFLIFSILVANLSLFYITFNEVIVQLCLYKFSIFLSRIFTVVLAIFSVFSLIAGAMFPDFYIQWNFEQTDVKLVAYLLTFLFIVYLSYIIDKTFNKTKSTAE